SAGHGSMLLYASAYLLGYPGISAGDLKNFRQLGSITPGHPEVGETPGVETTTGPLGQGLANAVGFAMAEAHLNARFGDGLVDHRTYVIASDGDLMEGISHEAISLAGHLKLRKLIVLLDDNGITIDGALSLSDRTDQLKRFEAAGWAASRVGGHDPEALSGALEAAKASDLPTLIACRTVIGKGAPTKAGTSKSHGAPLGPDEAAGARAAYGWRAAPFEAPDAILSAWRAAGARGAEKRASWEARLAAAPEATRSAFLSALAGDIPAEATAELVALKRRFSEEKPKLATRASSGEAVKVIHETLPTALGGSADLTGSNNTRTPDHETFDAANYGGRYVNYGVREHAMAAAMNGMALHGGVVPYAGTFLVFADYCRPSIRLAALMKQRVIYVMTHDSIGVGEDGPTHQPVEHLAALRAIPNLRVYRPADAVEAAECWQAALGRTDGPSLLALTRQGLECLRTTHVEENLSARGAYVLAEAENAAATLMATGSEVGVAMAACAELAAAGIAARVVSMPCWSAFEAQDAAYRAEVLGPSDAVKVGIEAAVSFGWDRYLGPGGVFIGMDGFGASAPAGLLYERFGITPAAVVAAVREKLG
ncbi:MAG: transketolase, partial [Pseudomonadota bacterium]